MNSKTFEEIINSPSTAVFVSHSSGKDSQTMNIFLEKIIEPERLFVIHAHLAGAEWPGTIQHIKDTVRSPVYVTTARKKDGSAKTFMGMADDRRMFPSPQYRQCTSDLKRGPIRRQIRAIMKDNPQFDTVVDCMGLRAEESPGRAKKQVWTQPKSLQTRNRKWYQWLPIHDWTTEMVFSYIYAAGQKPHWAYDLGMSRLSCMVCIMMSDRDLYISRQVNTKAYDRYIAKEKEIDYAFFMPRNGKTMFIPEILAEFEKNTPQDELDKIDEIIFNNL